ncbi:hypothetical protein MIMGU_mgv1a011057mg [Erythranthe guttata]|uniref:Cysteine protease n=1 Tax=Erythranthe guttata TaxID=4155 RepID=A0A022R6T3_ERYGU|nr:hypothetical protein MIMGU_mgv1a011057mg [Erythranthe guttata]
MKGFREIDTDPLRNSAVKKSDFDNSPKNSPGSVSSEAEPSIRHSNHKKSEAIWSVIWPTTIPIFGISNSNRTESESKNSGGSVIRKKSSSGSKNYYEGWRGAVRRVMMNGVTMRRIWGFSRATTSSSKSNIWLLGVCYQVSQEGEESSSDPTQSEGFAAFVEDFSSRVLITYRKGFSPIGDSKYISDVNWGCMLRSSQMLVAQAFLVHKLGRSWRKSPHKPLDQTYVEILHLFGDAEDSPCSVHNLLQAGKAYGLAPGSWVGPYAMCRTWESLVSSTTECYIHVSAKPWYFGG